jgi:hypothetical protein
LYGEEHSYNFIAFIEKVETGSVLSIIGENIAYLMLANNLEERGP